MNMLKRLISATIIALASAIAASAISVDFMNEVVGSYDWSFTSYLGTATPRTGLLTIAPTDRDDPDTPENEVLIRGIYEDYDVYATISEEDHTITIARQDIWIEDLSGKNIMIVKEYWDFDDEQWKMSEQPLVGQIADGVITFPPSQTISVYIDETGFLAMYGKNVMTKKVAVDPFTDAKWTYEGTARLQDGWLIPGFDLNQADYLYETMLEKDLNTPGRYRLVNPYGEGCPLREVNYCATGGWIVFNISDPDCVTVYPGVVSGFADSENGDFYMYNLEGYFAHALNYTLDEIKSSFPKQNVELSTYRNGIVEIKNAMFGVTAKPDGCYEWGTQTEKADMSTRIFMPESAATPTLDADTTEAAEYFNLQGIKVENPTNGVFIRRTGSKTEKVVIR